MAEIERDHNPHGLNQKEEIPSNYISSDELLRKLSKYNIKIDDTNIPRFASHNNIKMVNPYSSNKEILKQAQDPRLQAEGKAGQSTEMGVIFVMSANFLPDPGSEWIVGTCFKSPCVAAGNNELTSIYR